MFKHALVGVGDREGGVGAVALARNLVSDKGRLTLGYVYPSDAYVWARARETYHSAQREGGNQLLESVRSEMRIEAAQQCTSSPSIGRGLHELAENLDVDLLVVGSSRRGPWGRVLLGDDTRDSLNGAPCAIAVAPSGYADGAPAMRNIGVGYDSSAQSEHAMSVARALARQLGAKLSACQVVMFPPTLFIGARMPTEQDFDDLLVRARDHMTALDGVESHAVYGRTDEELAAFGAGLDLLILGSRDYGPVGRLLHGSTSQRLARMARCPLLVLTRAAREADSGNTARSGREMPTI